MSCVDAARDMISHIHQIFQIAPSLRRWSYYCFYCLQAVLVLMMTMVDDNSQTYRRRESTPLWIDVTELGDGSENQYDLQYYCELSINIFEQLRLKAAERCAQVVRSFLGRWKSSRTRSKRQHRHPQSQPGEDGSWQRPEEVLRQRGNDQQTEVSHIQSPQVSSTMSHEQPRFQIPESCLHGVLDMATTTQQEEQTASLNPTLKDGAATLVGGDKEVGNGSATSTHSLADLYAELESFSVLHGSRRGGDNVFDFASDGPASWSALGLNAPVEYILGSGFGNEEDSFPPS